MIQSTLASLSTNYVSSRIFDRSTGEPETDSESSVIPQQPPLQNSTAITAGSHLYKAGHGHPQSRMPHYQGSQNISALVQLPSPCHLLPDLCFKQVLLTGETEVSYLHPHCRRISFSGKTHHIWEWWKYRKSTQTFIAEKISMTNTFGQSMHSPCWS